MKSVRSLAYPDDGKRVETGAVQFGDDWPGLFIRGDEALFFAMDLINAADIIDSPDKKYNFMLTQKLRHYAELIRTHVFVEK